MPYKDPNRVRDRNRRYRLAHLAHLRETDRLRYYRDLGIVAPEPRSGPTEAVRKAVWQYAQRPDVLDRRQGGEPLSQALAWAVSEHRERWAS